MTWLNEFDERLSVLDVQALRRRRAVKPEKGARLNADGESLLAFCSNDCLEMSNDPLLRDAVLATVDINQLQRGLRDATRVSLLV